MLEVLEPRRDTDARRPHGQLPHARRGARFRRADAARGRAGPHAAATRSSRRPRRPASTRSAARSSWRRSPRSRVDEVDAVAPGRVAVIVTGERVEEIVAILRSKGLDAIDPRDQESRGLGADLIVLSAEGANGLEFDGVVVVEPGRDRQPWRPGQRVHHAAWTAHSLRRDDPSDPTARDRGRRATARDIASKPYRRDLSHRCLNFR